MIKFLDLKYIISQIEKSIEDKNYIAALALALTVPDKCGKIEFQNLYGGKQGYVNWYNEWCCTPDPADNKWEYYPEFDTSTHDTSYCLSSMPQSEPRLPYADGTVIYQLRCAILHDHSTELDYSKLESKNQLDEFELEITDNKGCLSVFSSGVLNDGEKRYIKIRIIDLCKMICRGATKYYDKNKEKVDEASNIKIIDRRDCIEF